jgi:hypothetical protein
MYLQLEENNNFLGRNKDKPKKKGFTSTRARAFYCYEQTKLWTNSNKIKQGQPR